MHGPYLTTGASFGIPNSRKTFSSLKTSTFLATKVWHANASTLNDNTQCLNLSLSKLFQIKGKELYMSLCSALDQGLINEKRACNSVTSKFKSGVVVTKNKMHVILTRRYLLGHGASLSEPHTSGTTLRIFCCFFLYTNHICRTYVVPYIRVF